MVKESDYALYDLVQIIDETSGNTKELAQRLGVTPRAIGMRIDRLRSLGVHINLERDGHLFYTQLTQSTDDIYDHLNRQFGLRPHLTPSSLCQEEQDRILHIYQAVIKKRRRFRDFFSNPEWRRERLRVILPCAVDSLIGKEFTHIQERDLDKYGLKYVREKYFEGSAFKLLSEAYTWMKPWDLYLGDDYWAGKKGEENRKTTIKWLIDNEVIDIETDFVNNLTKSEFSLLLRTLIPEHFPKKNMFTGFAKTYGFRPNHTPSTLSEDEQQEVVTTYLKLFDGTRQRLPRGFWQDPDLSLQRLRVLVPYSIENIICKDVAQCRVKDFAQAKLLTPLSRIYTKSVYHMLKDIYQWLKPWEIGRVMGMWTGKGSRKNKKDAIRWLIEDILNYSDDDVPKLISKRDFVNHGLSGLLDSFGDSPAEAICFAYPGKYSKEKFSHKKNKWSGRKAKVYARDLTRYIIEEKLQIPVADVPKKLTSKLFQQALSEEGCSGLWGNFSSEIYVLIDNAYPGKFKSWEVLANQKKWKGRKGKKNAREAIRWLVEEKLELTPQTAKYILHRDDFVKYDLRGLLNSPSLGLKQSISRALVFAYPDVYSKKDIPMIIKSLQRKAA